MLWRAMRNSNSHRNSWNFIIAKRMFDQSGTIDMQFATQGESVIVSNQYMTRTYCILCV